MAEPLRFERLEQLPDDQPLPQGTDLGTQALILGLKALSQRFVAAIAKLFTLATVGSAFWLWWSTPSPNIYQIVSLTIYALFVLAANWIVRR